MVNILTVELETHPGGPRGLKGGGRWGGLIEARGKGGQG